MKHLHLDPHFVLGPNGPIEVCRLAEALGQQAMEVTLRLYACAAIYAKNKGLIPEADCGYIESICKWKGKKGLCCGALARTGFIRLTKRGIRVLPQRWITFDGTVPESVRFRESFPKPYEGTDDLRRSLPESPGDFKSN
jgi:hypothetical protein